MKEMMKYRPKPERPVPRRFKRSDRPVWMSLHPATLAPIGAVVFGFLMVALYLLLYLAGYTVSPVRMVIGVLMAIVLGYGVTGGFVYYLLFVAEREIPRKEVEQHTFGRRLSGAQGIAPETPSEEPPESELEETVETEVPETEELE